MSENEPTIWGIHAGRSSEADSLFLKKSYIGIGWEEMGDLSKLPRDRDALKAQVAKVYISTKPGAIPVYAGLLHHYVYEIKKGDLVIYPSKQDRQIHIGRVEGDYLYNPKIDTRYPNLRAVKWLKEVPRTHFTQGALYEIGSAVTLFQVKTYADEYRAALEGKHTPQPIAKDETVPQVAEDVEVNTRDYIIKKLSQELKGHPLAHFVAHLLNKMGYRTRVSPPGPDGGIDIIAHKDELGFEPPIIKVQVKSTDGSISDAIVSALYGKVGAKDEYGLLVTLGTFTAQAKNFAQSKSNLRLIDGEELVDLVLLHYEEFDSNYKAVLPLKRTYVPAPEEDIEE